MNAKLASSVLVLAAIHTANCLALTPVYEKFKGSKLDSKRWYLYQEGGGTLVPEKGRLSFVSSRPSRADYASIELLTSRPRLDENWEVTLDLTNTTGFGPNAGCGFLIFNSGDRNDYVFVEFFGKSGIAGGVVIDGKNLPDGTFVLRKGVSKGGLRVSFNRKSKLLTFYASANVRKKGYEWKKIGSFSPTGKGGDVRADWKMMPATDEFGIQLFGQGVSRKIPAGKLTLDNLEITGDP